MKCCYSPINAGNMANGRNIKSSHLSHLGTLRKDIKITIKYHKRLEKKVLYIGNIKPQEGVQIHFLYIYSENRALVITIILRHLTLLSKAQWLAPYRLPFERKFSFCSCVGHLTTLSNILS